MKPICLFCGEDLHIPPSRAGRIKYCNAAHRKAGKLARRPDRFWPKVDASGGPTSCHIWTGHRNENGYGRFSIGTGEKRSLTLYAHRYAWELAHGPIPDGRFVLHHCDNPPCCNVLHLFLGDNQANSLDRDSKDRVRHGDTHANAKLTAAQVAQIRTLYATGAISHRKLAAAFGVSHQSISDLLGKTTWKRA